MMNDPLTCKKPRWSRRRKLKVWALLLIRLCHDDHMMMNDHHDIALLLISKYHYKFKITSVFSQIQGYLSLLVKRVDIIYVLHNCKWITPITDIYVHNRFLRIFHFNFLLTDVRCSAADHIMLVCRNSISCKDKKKKNLQFCQFRLALLQCASQILELNHSHPHIRQYLTGNWVLGPTGSVSQFPNNIINPMGN